MTARFDPRYLGTEGLPSDWLLTVAGPPQLALDAAFAHGIADAEVVAESDETTDLEARATKAQLEAWFIEDEADFEKTELEPAYGALIAFEEC